MDTEFQRTLSEHGRQLENLEARLRSVEALVGGVAARAGAVGAPARDGAVVGAASGLPASGETHAPPADRPKPPLPYAEYFVRLAVVCFVLVGALVLRVAALDGALDARTGTTLGLVYCALLIASAVLQRVWPGVGRHVLVLQLSGTLLAPLVVLETFHKSALLSLPLALGLTLAVSLASGIHGALRGERLLADAALTAGVVTLFALGVSADELAWRTSATLALVAVGLVVAHRRPWPELRPLVLAPVLVAGGIGGLLLAGKSGLPPGTMLILALAAVGTWVLVVASHALRHSRLQPREAVWLPVVTLWAYALAVHELSTVAVVSGAVIGTGALLAAAVAVVLGSRARVAILGGAASGVALVAVSVPVLEPWGLGMAALAVLVFGVAVGARSVWLAASSALLVVLAGLPVVRRFDGLEGGSAAVAAAAAGLVAVALFLHYGWARRSSAGLGAREDDELAPLVVRALAPFSLGWAIVTLFGALRTAALVPLGPGPAFDLTQTLLIAVLAMAALRTGAARGWHDLRIAGLAGVAVLAGKVLMADLPGLEGAPKVVSVVTLGVVSLLVSLTLSRQGARTGAKQDSAGAPGSR